MYLLCCVIVNIYKMEINEEALVMLLHFLQATIKCSSFQH